MELPRPYPDELVGSLLERAVRFFGIGRAQLLQKLSGRRLESHSFLLTSCAGLAEAHGMSFEEFLSSHTILPYVTAFLRRQEGQRVISMLLNGEHLRGNRAALTVRTSVDGQCLRCCPVCVKEELSRYGESYWHRTHQLAGVAVCEKHNAGLLVTGFRITRSSHTPPPHEVGCVQLPMLQDSSGEAQWAIACVSTLILRSAFDHEQLTERHRTLARMLGYLSPAGTVYPRLLLQDVHHYFGDPFLSKHQCSFVDDHKGQWPVKLLLESAKVATPVKHVLLMSFLGSKLKLIPPSPPIWSR